MKESGERVTKIMQLMAEHGYLSLDECTLLLVLRHGLKEPCAKVEASRYLKALQKRGFASSLRTPFLFKRKIHYLNPVGYEILYERNELRCSSKNKFTPEKFKPALLLHTLAIIQVRIIFESHSYTNNFRPERVLYYNHWQKYNEPPRGKFCDAEARIITKKRDYNAGIEVQLSRKSRDTYQKYLREINTSTKLDVILWVCQDDTIKNGICEAARERYTESNHFFTTLPELKAKGILNSTWVNKFGEMGHIFS